MSDEVLTQDDLERMISEFIPGTSYPIRGKRFRLARTTKLEKNISINDCDFTYGDDFIGSPVFDMTSSRTGDRIFIGFHANFIANEGKRDPCVIVLNRDECTAFICNNTSFGHEEGQKFIIATGGKRLSQDLWSKIHCNVIREKSPPWFKRAWRWIACKLQLVNYSVRKFIIGQ